VNSYRVWQRGCAGGSCGVAKNVSYAINSTRYNRTNNYNDMSFGSNHQNGANFVMCDGSVQFLTQNVDLFHYKATASRDGGEAQTVVP
jgi:prepilin-type processing-associated H-X9-DG protein